jgi:uncharacterized membrane protein YphA (DoxX/SURF4 family)
MKPRTIAYWTTTGLVAFAFAAGGLFDVMRAPQVLETMAHLGYPAYVASLLGVWKLLGAVAIVAPGAPRLKEWAYAGIVFDLSGAVVSHASVGDVLGQFAAPLVLLALALTSWALRPASRVLPSRNESAPRATASTVGTPHAGLAT